MAQYTLIWKIFDCVVLIFQRIFNDKSIVSRILMCAYDILHQRAQPSLGKMVQYPLRCFGEAVKSLFCVFIRRSVLYDVSKSECEFSVFIEPLELRFPTFEHFARCVPDEDRASLTRFWAQMRTRFALGFFYIFQTTFRALYSYPRP